MIATITEITNQWSRRHGLHQKAVRDSGSRQTRFKMASVNRRFMFEACYFLVFVLLIKRSRQRRKKKKTQIWVCKNWTSFVKVVMHGGHLCVVCNLGKVGAASRSPFWNCFCRYEWFHMVNTIADIKLKSISAIVVALIAGEWFLNNHYDRLFLFIIWLFLPLPFRLSAYPLEKYLCLRKARKDVSLQVWIVF